MQADLSERTGRTATTVREAGMEYKRQAIWGILIFLAVLAALSAALLASAAILIATTGGSPEESLVRVVVQLMARPYWYY